jgi:hypothetical protein
MRASRACTSLVREFEVEVLCVCLSVSISSKSGQIDFFIFNESVFEKSFQLVGDIRYIFLVHVSVRTHQHCPLELFPFIDKSLNLASI